MNFAAEVGVKVGVKALEALECGGNADDRADAVGAKRFAQSGRANAAEEGRELTLQVIGAR
jgi:hypothetical protein